MIDEYYEYLGDGDPEWFEIIDTKQASQEAYESIQDTLSDTKFQVIRYIYNYRQQCANRPTVDELYDYMISNGIKLRRNTLPPRLTQLRQAGIIHSEKVKGIRATLNELTTKGMDYVQSDEFKRRLERLK